MYLNKSFYDFVTARSVRAFGCMSVKFLLKRVSVYYCLVKLELLGAFNPLSTNPTKWPHTLKQFVGKLATTFLSVFDHFVKLALNELRWLVGLKLIRVE